MKMGCRICDRYFQDTDMIVIAQYDGLEGCDVNVYGCPYCRAPWTSLYCIPYGGEERRYEE